MEDTLLADEDASGDELPLVNRRVLMENVMRAAMW